MILKLAAVTCGIYFGLALIVRLASIVLARVSGGWMFFGRFWEWAAIFGIGWLISFLAAWRLVVVPLMGTGRG